MNSKNIFVLLILDTVFGSFFFFFYYFWFQVSNLQPFFFSKKKNSNICVANRKLFFHEHKLYTQQQLQTHNFEGDSNDSSFNGHPQCKFCRQYFYGKDELYEHLELSHEHCHICRKNGNFTQYYPNYYYLVYFFLSFIFFFFFKNEKKKLII